MWPGACWCCGPGALRIRETLADGWRCGNVRRVASGGCLSWGRLAIGGLAAVGLAAAGPPGAGLLAEGGDGGAHSRAATIRRSAKEVNAMEREPRRPRGRPDAQRGPRHRVPESGDPDPGLAGPPGAVVGSGIMTRSWVARDRGAACERSLTGQVMPTARPVGSAPSCGSRLARSRSSRVRAR